MLCHIRLLYLEPRRPDEAGRDEVLISPSRSPSTTHTVTGDAVRRLGNTVYALLCSVPNRSSGRSGWAAHRDLRGAARRYNVGV